MKNSRSSVAVAKHSSCFRHGRHLTRPQNVYCPALLHVLLYLPDKGAQFSDSGCFSAAFFISSAASSIKIVSRAAGANTLNLLESSLGLTRL
jgi:hypothetical protein